MLLSYCLDCKQKQQSMEEKWPPRTFARVHINLRHFRQHTLSVCLCSTLLNSWKCEVAVRKIKLLWWNVRPCLIFMKYKACQHFNLSIKVCFLKSASLYNWPLPSIICSVVYCVHFFPNIGILVWTGGQNSLTKNKYWNILLQIILILCL